MSNTAGPIYEVTLSVDREIVDAFDDWLANHVQEMLDVPGFLKAESFEIEGLGFQRDRLSQQAYTTLEPGSPLGLLQQGRRPCR